MDESERDAKRAYRAVQAIIDGRDDDCAVMVTLEVVVGTLLLMRMNGETRRAALALSEDLVPSIERRLAGFSATAEGRS